MLPFYAVLIMLVYFAQLTAVRLSPLGQQAAQVLDYKNFGLFFSYDLLGYAFMTLATFFIAFTIQATTRLDKWLKALLMIHGIFAVSCVIIPMLGLFHANMTGGDFLGVIVLEIWCHISHRFVYFLICILRSNYPKWCRNVILLRIL